MIHKPVLAKEVLEILNPKTGEFFIDGTLGGGGHARLILEALGNSGIFLGVDRDALAIEEFKKNTQFNKPKIILVNDNFSSLPQILATERLPRADGLILDLGISSDQLERTGRGFSFQKNEPLLMTFDDKQKPVRDILNDVDEDELSRIIKEYSDERYSQSIAREIKRRLPLATTFALRETILSAVPANYENGRIDPATRTFMALRIYANQEFENLKSILSRLSSIVKPGGRIAIITFHSNEDRIVKNVLRDAAKLGNLRLINKKVITAEYSEIKINPRARSAKLRAAIMASESEAFLDPTPEVLLTSSSFRNYSGIKPVTFSAFGGNLTHPHDYYRTTKK